VLPLVSANDVKAGQPNAECGVRNDAEDSREKEDQRVVGRRVCIATFHGPRVALVFINWSNRWRRMATIVAPRHGGDGRSDVARGSKCDDQRDKGLVEQHRTDQMRAVAVKFSGGLENQGWMSRLL